jgi:hypothetical protein
MSIKNFILLVFTMGLSMCISVNSMGDEKIVENKYMPKRIQFLQEYYKIGTIEKQIKSPEKRIVPLNKTFNNFPFSIKIASISERKSSALLTIMSECLSEEKKEVITGDTPVYFDITLEDTKTGHFCGMIAIAYSNSLDLCRRECFAVMANCPMPNELVAYSHVPCNENIGDDICFILRKPNYKLYFIRQNTLFVVNLVNAEKNTNINIIELAKYIDQKFVELNKELNKPEKKP